MNENVEIKFSVLMSVYKKENPDWFRKAVESVIKQTVVPNEIVIIEDGPLTYKLYDVCQSLKEKYQDLIHIYSLKENKGLGLALQYGVLKCRYDYIARMDTDDIAKSNRFELQIAEFRKNKNLAICGGYIEEFDDDENKPVSIRKVPESTNEIYKFAKMRNPFNHMTVMFKKNDVIEAGNYQDCGLLEDYYLWYKMIIKKYYMINIPKVLVSARTGNDMFIKRGGWNYFCNESKFYKMLYKSGYIIFIEYIFVLLMRFISRVCPNFIRLKIYRIILR